jgi:hypothetical protein
MSNSKNRKLASLSSTTRSCYRLYAGHGNWINLSAKTTQDLLQVFQKGDPCRYQLAAGLFIDIIPNDVDCNSKNIDMLGLMRADLVYEPQMTENHVQQLMAHYVRNLLDEQGIIDAFPPLRQGEDLPIITSIPMHRHLSLVPSVAGTVRRGPKSSANSVNPMYQSGNGNSTMNSSSASSLTGMGDEEQVPLPSSSSSTTTRGSSPNTKKKNGQTTRRAAKRARQNSSYTMQAIELTSQKRQIVSLEISNINNSSNFSPCPPALTLTPFVNNSDHQHQQNDDGNYSSDQSNSNAIIPMTFHSHHQQQQQGSSSNSTIWMPSYQNLPSSTSQRPGFNFEFGVDFDHSLQQQQRQSPTDILHEYDSHFSHQMNGDSSFEGEHSLYSESAQQILHHHHQQTLLEDQHDRSNNSPSPIMGSFVPASPIPDGWINGQLQHRSGDSTWVHSEPSRNNNNNDTQSTADGTGKHKTNLASHPTEHQKIVSKKNFGNEERLRYPEFATEANNLPVMERIFLHQQQQKTSSNGVLLSHAGGNSP